MPAIPVMLRPSLVSTLVFTGLVLGLAGLLVWGVARAGRAAHESAAQTRGWVLGTAAGVAGWLGLTAAVSASGVLESPMLPPPAALFGAGSMLVSIAAAFSPLGTRLVRGLPVVALIAVQAFRLPLELVLHAWMEQGTLPVQMSFEGNNFDIVSGVLALLIGVAFARKAPPRALVWAFNAIGFGLLLNVMSIAVLSSPLPIRLYMNEPPVLLAYHFPYGWIIPFCVGGAMFLHLLVFRWLLGAQEQRHPGGHSWVS
jgi:hypothetical protein